MLEKTQEPNQFFNIPDDSLAEKLRKFKKKYDIYTIHSGPYSRNHAETQVLRYGGTAYYLSSDFKLMQLSRPEGKWSVTEISLED